MSRQRVPFVALTCPWEGSLQVFVLSTTDGLVGETVASGPDEVEAQARKLIAVTLGYSVNNLPIQAIRR